MLVDQCANGMSLCTLCASSVPETHEPFMCLNFLRNRMIGRRRVKGALVSG